MADEKIIHLIVYTDGGARGNPGPAASGVSIQKGTGEQLHGFGRYLGKATNNVAEYTAVIDALEWIFEHMYNSKEKFKIDFRMDSLLVASQVTGKWRVKDLRLQSLLRKIREAISRMPASYSFSHIPRSQNKQADWYVNHALDNAVASSLQ